MSIIVMRFLGHFLVFNDNKTDNPLLPKP